MRQKLILNMLCGFALLAGCASQPPQPTAATTNTTTDNNAAVTNRAPTPTQPVEQPLSAEKLAKQQADAAGKIIYFDYDNAEIKPQFVNILTAHAKYLNAAPSVKVRLEGHADERGTREYNIGLGERRAQAVRRALLLQGVTEAQISTVSFGEERPAVVGSDEASYAKNRRVELAY